MWFFQILTYINFRETNGINMAFFTQALCWEYYTKPKNLVVIQFIKYPNFELKIKKRKKKKKRKEKNIRIWSFFQILTHDNYEQTNGVQLEFFYTSPILRIPQQTEGGSIIHFKYHNFKIKS